MLITSSSNLIDRCRHVINEQGMKSFNAVEVAKALADTNLLGLDSTLDVRDALTEFYGEPNGI